MSGGNARENAGLKKALLVLLIGLAFLVSLLLTKTLLLTSAEPPVEPARHVALNEDGIARRLADVLRFPTISNLDPTKVDTEVLVAQQQYFEENFPMLHSRLQRELINRYALLYSWQGRDRKLKPIVLMAHQDVVPIATATESEWVHPPFAGAIADGYIWGRGALDDKSSLMGIFEAIEALLRDGFQPNRTIYVVSGHDEEVGGHDGAVKIVEVLRSRNVQPEFVLDEGGAIVHGVIPGLSSSVAAVGVSEKGYLTLELTVAGKGGHSSTPPRHTCVGLLCKAITRIEDNPFPTDMSYAARFFDYVGPRMPFIQRLLFANQWLFSPLVERAMSGSPDMSAGIRTTIAPTVFNAGVKENVLPARATALVNFRIMPGDTVASVSERVKKTIDDERVEIRPLGTPNEPSPMSDIRNASYEMLRKTMRQVARDRETIVAPYLCMAATDSRHFCEICDKVYRFLPFSVSPEALKTIHGVNERISTENYVQMARFYYQLLKNCEEL